MTNAQYAAFLNEKAKSDDPLLLYATSMGGDVGGITRSGSSGSFTYTTKPNMADKPVNYVTWYDAICFANWLSNGQGAGDTETGAYTILGGFSSPLNGLSITRNTGAPWFLPSENEWYKAAYYQPVAEGGDADSYWQYPTASNVAPAPATANAVGDISNPGPNVANYLDSADWNGQNGNVTTVGSAGLLSESFYGTSDQGGNVIEWNETLIDGSFRGLRGGSFIFTFPLWDTMLRSSNRTSLSPWLTSSDIGFRVASIALGAPFTLHAGAGTASTGGADATFGFTGAVGAFSSAFYQPSTPDQIASTLAALNAGQSAFILPGNPAQIWDLHYTGSFTGSATVTLHYDPAAVTVGPSLLRIRHWTGEAWETPKNQVVDPVAHTITFDTESFSPFLLTVVPEPSSLAMAGLGVALLAVVARRRLWRA